MKKPIISIITPYYNCQDYIEETAKSILNQTFPAFEWIIVDDGSSKEGKNKLEEISKLDERIKIIKENTESMGPAIARDIGIMNSHKTSKYIVFLDADDLFEKTYLECCYWTLETHPEASWTYTDSINFGAKNFLWRKWYNVEWEKNENILIVSACVRKKDLIEVGGFGVKEKKVYEDWYLWLKLIKKGKYPIRMNSLLTYYRQKESMSELKESNTNNKKNAMKLISSIKNDIIDYKNGIQFPKFDYNWQEIKEKNENIIPLKNKKDNKIHVLMIIPWMITGGADRFNLDLISKMDRQKFEFTVISTLPSENEWRKYFTKYATVYDLTTFLDMKDWVSFINYIIEKENINLIFNTNSQFGYKILPYLKAVYPEIPIVDYVHMEEWYWRNGGYSRDSSILQSIIDKTYTCNENSRKIFINKFDRKQEEVKTIYVGVDEKWIEKRSVKNQDYQNRLNLKAPLKKNIPTLAYICRIADQKRPYLFFEVCKKLAKEEKVEFNVIVVGEGPFLDGLKNKVKENELDEFFYFTGNIENTKDVYEISDIFINTSIKEGIALTSYESIAMGVPVVASDVGGQKELITNDVGEIVPCLQKETEILNFNYSDDEIQNYVHAIKKILNNLEYYKSNCRKKNLKKFTVDNMVKEMENEFTEIVHNPNKEKIENGKRMSACLDIFKELITIYLDSSKDEYKYLVEKFNKENVHIVRTYDKHAQKMLYYEHTLEYKLKHPIVVILRKIGIYDNLKNIFLRQPTLGG